MKSLLVFAFCGITICWAATTCPKDLLSKCPRVPEKITNEADLNQMCRQTECWLEIGDRCGGDFFAPHPVGDIFLSNTRKTYNALCNSVSTREKYLRHVTCIEDSMKAAGGIDLVKKCGIEGDEKEEFCKTYPSGFECMVDYIRGGCGEEASDVFRKISYNVNIFGCDE